MNNFVKSIFILCGLSLLFSQAVEANELHIFLPGLQYRYENDSNQSIDYKRYTNYNLAAIVFDDYLVGFEFNEQNQRSQNGSVQISQQFQEFCLNLGYFFYSKILSAQEKIIFDLGPIVSIGQNRTTVLTDVSTASVQSIGEDNLVLAAGAQATLRVNFFLLQPEIKWATSRSYQPSSISIFAIRAGFRIGF